MNLMMCAEDVGKLLTSLANSAPSPAIVLSPGFINCVCNFYGKVAEVICWNDHAYIEHYFLEVLFIVLWKVVLTF